MALNGGPVFTFTPAISMFASRAEEPDVDRLWTELSQDGKVLMELQPYPFSRKFGWLVDRFGLSWQLNLDGRRRISPFLMFTGAQSGKAQEAMETYVSMFEGSGIHQVERFGPGQEETEGTVMHGRFSLAGQEFMAMDSRRDHGFSFTPAVSFFVNCETQPEVDDLWERLSDGGKKGQCGWLEDRYGVSWQIVPTALGTLLADKDPARSRNVMKAMLGMTKLDVAALKAAAEQ
jgi:predicted 3-demethylubiquinone-9 3-methyltransferase (glyoxalase superfamily)